MKSRLSRLSALKTPKTEPRADRGEMHPELLHQTTAKAPDSGLKLGFADVPAIPPHTVASAQNTPSKTHTTTNADLSYATFDFNFGSETQLSSEAQQLMDKVREEAARIKAQMQAEKEVQKTKDAEAEALFDGINTAGRKIAKPKGKAGRFSDIHMAQFKKMDSIANHASAFRGKPNFAQPTTQSLKRSGSKANLDEMERPRTAGKGTPGRKPPPFLGRPTSVSPFKSIPQQPELVEKTMPSKRARHSEFQDVSSSRPSEQPQSVRPAALPRPISSSILSPTKASLARSATSQIPVASPNKAPGLTRATSMKSLRPVSTAAVERPSTSHGAGSPQVSSRLSRTSASPERPLPPLPHQIRSSPFRGSVKPTKSMPALAASADNSSFVSKLPKFSGLKSILRSPRKTDASELQDNEATPHRRQTAASASGSVKKVDFTPSVKSRYAVKLAAGSPSPAKLPKQLTPGDVLAPAIPYDSAAYTLEDKDNWEDASSEVEYPTLPSLSSPRSPAKVENAFSEKVKEYSRRESKEFKSIFTTLHPPSRATVPSTLTSVNTTVNKCNATTHANKVMKSPSSTNFSKPSPTTIRRVRTSGVTEEIQPFEDADVKTMPHGLPGKKRRRASDDQHSADHDSEKENRRISVAPKVPGGWRDSTLLDEEEQDEGEKRGGKRARTGPAAVELSLEKTASPVKKPRQSSAREVAKQNAKERKSGRSLMSLSRLNFLSQPKQRS